MKTYRLRDAALDWAVAKAIQPKYHDAALILAVQGGFRPAKHWEQGGPIIELHSIGTKRLDDGSWQAWARADDTPTFARGATLLVAAMRCYCASKLGADIEIPEELQ